MSMFTKRGSDHGGTIETIIGSSVKVEGDFVGQGDVTVEGAVTGTLKTEGNIYIKEGARVEAEVMAKNITTAGMIKGNVTVKEKIELSSTSEVYGNVEARILSVESGAKIHGQCQIGARAQQPEKKTNARNTQKLVEKVAA